MNEQIDEACRYLHHYWWLKYYQYPEGFAGPEEEREIKSKAAYDILEQAIKELQKLKTK